jgi:hypothetical protein
VVRVAMIRQVMALASERYLVSIIMTCSCLWQFFFDIHEIH